MKKPRIYQHFIIEMRLREVAEDNLWTVRDSAPTLKSAENIKLGLNRLDRGQEWEYRVCRVIQLVEVVNG